MLQENILAIEENVASNLHDTNEDLNEEDSDEAASK